MVIGILSVECSEGELSEPLVDSATKSKGDSKKDEKCLADYHQMLSRRTAILPEDISNSSSTDTPRSEPKSQTDETNSTNSTTKPIDLGSVLKKIVKHKITKKILDEVAKTSTVGRIFKGIVDIFSDDPMREMKEEILNAIEKQTKILQESLMQVSEQVRNGKN